MASLIKAPPAYAELICRTHYSFLEGASHPSELVRQAVQLGLTGLAITDRDGVYGMPKAWLEAKNHPELRFITGAILTLEDHAPLVLLAQNRAAYGVLCRLLTESHRDQPKGSALLSWKVLESMLKTYPGSNGLVALPFWEKARCDWERLQGSFQERLFIPLCRTLDGRDRERTELALAHSRRLGARLVATQDVHYHTPNRRLLQDVLAATRLNISLKEAGSRLLPNAERHLKNPLQMSHLFRDLPDAIQATLDIAQSCTFLPSELRYRYPSEWIPDGHTAQSYLEHLVREGTKIRYPTGMPDAVIRQLQHELELVQSLQFADYFLTIWEIVDFARKRNILCQGRGSAANSAICYCLGITAIDPVRMNLLFERFLSAERGEPPDIDVDFEHERREEVIQHIYERYGRDRAAMVSAVITYRKKSALRDVGKALGVDPETGRSSGNRTIITADSNFGRIAELQVEHRAKATLTADSKLPPETAHLHALGERLGEEIEGFPRHLSIHSGGFTLSADPIIETVPVEPARMEGRTIVQWDKNDLDALGLLKVDILALGMLTALQKSLALVNEGRPAELPKLELATLPAEDPATYAMMRRADTVGVFQIESRAQMNMLGRLEPRTFYDLVIEIALVRPGPIVGKMVHPYLKRRKGLEPIDIPDPRLEPILGRTLGVPLFQEQVMKMAIVLADFTPGEADQLRRAIGAWRSNGSIEEMGHKLRNGLLRNGLPEAFVELIFTQIQGFAEYGFPESHSASFALLAYASSWLKCHHPAEFTCALVNSQPLGFYSNASLIEDARRHGVKILPVHPHHSEWDCQVIRKAGATSVGSIQLGWRVVQGLGEDAAAALLEERKQAPFRSLHDFLVRSKLRRDVLQRLALADAFRCFGFEARQALWECLAFDLQARPETSGQLSLFSAPILTAAETQKAELSPKSASSPSLQPESTTSLDRVHFQPLGGYAQIQADYFTYGLSHRGHPMKELRQLRRDLPPHTSEGLKQLPHNARVKFAGMIIVRQRPPTAKGTAFATLEDETGFIDLILWKKVHEEHRHLFESHSFLKGIGTLQREGTSVGILVQRLEPVFPEETALDAWQEKRVRARSPAQ